MASRVLPSPRMDTRTAWHPLGQSTLPSYDPRRAAPAPQSGGVVVRLSAVGAAPKTATRRGCYHPLCACVSPLALLCGAFFTFLQAWLLVAAGTLACEPGETCWRTTDCELLSVGTERASDGTNRTTGHALVTFEAGGGTQVTQVAFSSVGEVSAL